METRGWGDLVVESDEFQNYHGSGSSASGCRCPGRPAPTLALADFPTALKTPYLHTAAQYRESTPLLDAIPQITVSSNSVEWVKWAPNPVPAATVVAEGAAKPEMALTATAVSRHPGDLRPLEGHHPPGAGGHPAGAVDHRIAVAAGAAAGPGHRRGRPR